MPANMKQQSAKSEDEKRFVKTKQLIHDIHKSHMSATKLFKQWDEDGSGTVSRKECVKGLKVTLAGKGYTTTDFDRFFTLIDGDNSGLLNFNELGNAVSGLIMHNEIGLKKRIHKLANMSHLNAAMVVQAAFRGMQGRKRAKAFKLAKLPESDPKVYRALQLICTHLAKDLQKVTNVFREWDDDHNGKVNKKEWRQGIGLLGIEAAPTVSDALFCLLDADHSGALEYEELRKKLQAPHLHGLGLMEADAKAHDESMAKLEHDKADSPARAAAVQRAHDEAKARIDSKRKAKRISAMLNFIDEYSDETSLRSTLTECKLFGSHRV